MKIVVLITVLCFAASLQPAKGDGDWTFSDIKLKDILGGIFQSVRHDMLVHLNGTKFGWNFIKHLDVFTDQLTVGDLLSISSDGGQHIFDELVDSVRIGFEDTPIQNETVAAYTYLITHCTLGDILAVFIGSDTRSLWTVLKESYDFGFAKSPYLDEIQNERQRIVDALTGSNVGAEQRLQEQYVQDGSTTATSQS